MAGTAEGEPVAKRNLKGVVDDSACTRQEACNIVATVLAFTGPYHPVVPPNAAEQFDAERNALIETVLACAVASVSLPFEDGRVISIRRPRAFRRGSQVAEVLSGAHADPGAGPDGSGIR